MGGSLAKGTIAEVIEDCVTGGVARAALGRSARPDNLTVVANAPNEIAATDQKEAEPSSRLTGKAAGFATPAPLFAAIRPGTSSTGSPGVIIDSKIRDISGFAVENRAVRSRPGWWRINPNKRLRSDAAVPTQSAPSGQLDCIPPRVSVVSVVRANASLLKSLKNALLDEITLGRFDQLNYAIAILEIRLKRVQDLCQFLARDSQRVIGRVVELNSRQRLREELALRYSMAAATRTTNDFNFHRTRPDT